jgi:hypothetical protein
VAQGGKHRETRDMRCYFHLVNGRERLTDPHGIKVPHLAMAHAEALRAIEELREEAFELDVIGWSLVVADGAGRSLFEISLDGSADQAFPVRLLA